MRAFRLAFIFLTTWLVTTGTAAELKIVKVLPQHLDTKGRASLSPSLYERDAYQAYLRQNANQRAGLCFHVQWKGHSENPLKLRVELRGVKGNELTNKKIERAAEGRGWFRRWSTITLTGKQFKALGQLSAWRAVLVDGEKEVAEQKSFLW